MISIGKLVSEKIAILLKKNKFNQPCPHLYTNGKCGPTNLIWANSDLEDDEYSAPNYQVVCDWILENYNFHIELVAYPHEDGVFYWAYKIMHLRKDCAFGYFKVYQKAGFDTRDDALENAIEYILTNLNN